MRAWALWALLADVAAQGAAPLPHLRIAGSSTVYPVAASWASRLAGVYTAEVAGGGSSRGAARICSDRSDPEHVDIGCMSRDWKDREAVRLDDGYTMECVGSKNRLTQVQVGIDGLAVVVAKGGFAHDCLTGANVGGLTLAELRWIFSDWSDSALEADGVDLGSILENDNGNGVKEWSDLHASCAQVPINPYGAGNLSGTHEFFGEVVFCKDCFKGKSGFQPEDFRACEPAVTAAVRAMNATAEAAWIDSGQRPSNCVLDSESDTQILEWTMADGAGIAYFGFAHFSAHVADLTVVRVANDGKKGVRHTQEAVIAPSPYTIVDGSYIVFRRPLFMNIDNEAWDLVRGFMLFGFSADGQAQVVSSGYAAINQALLAKMVQRIPAIGVRGNELADYVPAAPESCAPGKRLATMHYRNVFGMAKVKYTCENCPAGSFKPSNQAAECTVCGPGTFAHAEGMTVCTVCDRGLYSAANATACQLCAMNEYAAAPGHLSCDPCLPGQYTLQLGSWKCQRCPSGRYRQAGNSTCLPCAGGLTTAYLGAVGPSDCICREGTYLSLSAGTCLSCPLKMQCPLGSTEASLRSVAAGSGPTVDSTGASVPYPLVDRAFWTPRDDPLFVYRCTGPLHCPGGDPASCAPKLSGLACAHCTDGYFWNGEECFECSSADTSAFIFPLVPVLLCFVVVCFLYVTSRDPLDKWGSCSNCLIALGFVTLNHFQTLHLINTADVPKASSIGDTWEFWALTNDVLSVFRTDCAGFGGFTAKFIISCASPLGLLAITYIAYISSQFLAMVVRRPGIAMDLDRVWNVFFSLVFTFFVGIANMSLSLFKCSDSPNMKATNANDPSVICYEGDWNSLVFVAVFSVLIYCVGCGSLFGKAIFSASRGDNFSDEIFQKRWKFLFIKFRPDVHWWALVLLVRGLIENIGFAFLTQGLSQLYLVMFVEALYMCSTAFFMPWRLRSANWCSIVASVSLLFACTMTAMFIDRNTSTDSTVAAMAIAMSFGPLLFAGMLAVHVVVVDRCAKHDHTLEEARLKEVIGALVGMAEETYDELFRRTSHWDRYYLRKFCDVIESEFLAKPVRHHASTVATRICDRAAIRQILSNAVVVKEEESWQPEQEHVGPAANDDAVWQPEDEHMASWEPVGGMFTCGCTVPMKAAESAVDERNDCSSFLRTLGGDVVQEDDGSSDASEKYAI